MTRYIVLIGAARSGTKIMRDVLAEATGAGKVPYDIAYVWRHGNESARDDALTPDQVSAGSRRFIRGFVDRYAAGSPPSVIEKTVGNTLRVPVVAAVLPDAVFVHLIRDGVDVIESTRRQWTEPSNLRYLFAKARHFPLRLAPRYGAKYVRSLTHRRAGGEGRVGSWGVRYPGIEQDLRTVDLLTVCARQWRESVQYSVRDLAAVTQPVVEVRYEDLIAKPRDVLTRVAASADLSLPADQLDAACATIVVGRAGVGRSALSASELASLDAEVGDLLETLGYPRPVSSSVKPDGSPGDRENDH